MSQTSFLSNCPKCGYIAEASIEDGIIVKIRCQMCGYQGELPASPDIEKRPWRV
jgi:hypothetical protein